MILRADCASLPPPSANTPLKSPFKSSRPWGGTSGKESTCQCKRCNRRGFDPWVGKIPWEEEMATYSSILEKLMDRGTWEATVQGVTKSRTWLNVWAHTSCLSGNWELVFGHESTLFLGCWPPKWSNFSSLTLISQVMAFEQRAAGPGFSSSIARGTILNIL